LKEQLLKMKKKAFILLVSIGISCQSQQRETNVRTNEDESMITAKIETATFSGGCFWCTEAVFLELKGVQKVQPGYSGGFTKNPTYKDISTGTTGHAEVIEITYDANVISFGTLLEVFFATHDPTTLNRQGNDIGTQYRSEIFYHDAQQKEIVQAYIELLALENTFGKPIVTQLSPATTFYPAEDYHVNYYNQNKEQGYCTYVITPKIDKLKKEFSSILK
jgi:peptide-methionine (S)-S-oxide reductase